MSNKKHTIFAHVKGKLVKSKQCARTIPPLRGVRGVSLGIMKQSKYFSEMLLCRKTSFKLIFVFKNTPLAPLKGGIVICGITS